MGPIPITQIFQGLCTRLVTWSKEKNLSPDAMLKEKSLTSF